MKHPDFESLVRFSGSELSSRLLGRTAAHLAACEACTTELAWISDVRAAALEATALSAPESAWSAIDTRLDAGDLVVLPPIPVGTTGSRIRTAAIAAGLVLCASMAAALVPQTGVRAWLDRQLAGGSDTATLPVPSVVEPGASELALAPVDGVLHIELTSATSPLQLRVRFTDGSELEVRATGAAAAAHFLVGAGRIDITDATGGEILLSLPRSAQLITVDVAGVRAVEYNRPRLSVFAPGADTVGAELILPVR